MASRSDNTFHDANVLLSMDAMDLLETQPPDLEYLSRGSPTNGQSSQLPLLVTQKFHDNQFSSKDTMRINDYHKMDESRETESLTATQTISSQIILEDTSANDSLHSPTINESQASSFLTQSFQLQHTSLQSYNRQQESTQVMKCKNQRTIQPIESIRTQHNMINGEHQEDEVHSLKVDKSKLQVQHYNHCNENICSENANSSIQHKDSKNSLSSSTENNHFGIGDSVHTSGLDIAIHHCDASETAATVRKESSIVTSALNNSPNKDFINDRQRDNPLEADMNDIQSSEGVATLNVQTAEEFSHDCSNNSAIQRIKQKKSMFIGDSFMECAGENSDEVIVDSNYEVNADDSNIEYNEVKTSVEENNSTGSLSSNLLDDTCPRTRQQHNRPSHKCNVLNSCGGDVAFSESYPIIDTMSAQEKSNKSCTNTVFESPSYDSTMKGTTKVSPRKLYNPYAKSKVCSSPIISPQSSKPSIQCVKNPYAKQKTVTQSSGLEITDLDKKMLCMNEATLIATNTREDRAALITDYNRTSNLPPQKSGMSYSLSMAERLPSRSLSYQPAEILTVGELYRYMYHEIDKVNEVTVGSIPKETVAIGSTSSTAKLTFRKLHSVRITGTLLCVSSSIVDENDGSKGDLYNTGTWLLVGDPLDKTRSLILDSRGIPTNPTLDANHSSTLSKTSIQLLSETPTSDPPKINSANMNLKSVSDASTDTFSSPTADQTNNTYPSSVLSSKKVIIGGELFSSNKKRKLVCARNAEKSANRTLNFRKFQTPKRKEPTVIDQLSGSMISLDTVSSVSKGRLPRPNGNIYSAATKNNNPNQVIQTHPSPLVAVWCGSSYNDDGLDGTVVGDLVMIMGEIVDEHCAHCRVIRTITQGDEKQVGDCNLGETCWSEPPPSLFETVQLLSVKDAARCIAAFVSRDFQGSQVANRKSSCLHCIKFLKARFVKNANGTDMMLQKKALQCRREYMTKRREQLLSLMPYLSNHLSVGCGL